MFRIKVTGTIFLLLYLILITSLQFIDYSKSLNEFNDFTNKGKSSIKVNIFPWPYLTIKEVSNDHFLLNSAICKFSFFSLLTLNPRINYINIEALDVFSERDEMNILDNSLIIQEILKLKNLFTSDIQVFVKELFLYSKS